MTERGGKSTRFKPGDPRVVTHGMSKTPMYKAWHTMKTRCSGKAIGKTRKTYFDRGIRVCDRLDRAIVRTHDKLIRDGLLKLTT